MDSGGTLRDGIKRFCEENAAVFTARDMSPAAQEFFRCHDTAHVVFGCDTSIFGEGILKMFTIFGTPRAFIHARRMSRPWPWSEHARYLDRSLEDIRGEFNIKVIRRAGAVTGRRL